MPGPATLKTQKRLLTRYANQLSLLLQKLKTEEVSPNPTSAINLRNARATIFELNAKTKLVSDALHTFNTTLDGVSEAIPEEQQQQTEQYAESMEKLIEEAWALAIDLESKQITANEDSVEVVTPKLPAIPIPSFSGKVWEFSNFWTLFHSNVHAQPLTRLQKFDYLINALQGEARELIRRYPVTEENYDHAVTLLHAKYGDNSKVISQLQTRLEQIRAEHIGTNAQRRLLEGIFPIVSQLQDLQISLDGKYFAHKILSKFTAELQRKVLERCLPQCKLDSDWKLSLLLSTIDDLLTTEEHINDMIHERTRARNDTPETTPQRKTTPNQSIAPCMFCSSTQHRSIACPTYATIPDRRTQMQQHNRCLNCAREGHFAYQCSSRGCRRCQGKRHHHTICPQQLQITRHDVTQFNDRSEYPSPGSGQHSPTTTPPKRRTAASAHPLETQRHTTLPPIAETEEEKTILLNTKSVSVFSDVLLLTGIARIRDKTHKTWKEVEILFDSGADQSFISQSLANDLGLTCTAKEEFLMYTFGMKDPTRTQCDVTQVDLWDHHGEQHTVQLCTTPILTGRGRTARLTQEDIDFVVQHNIQLSKPTVQQTSRPQILLGCDQMWDLLETFLPRYTLPSGLQLIPSKLGYLLTGKRASHHEVASLEEEHASVVATISTVAETEDEVTRWDKYWTMDSAGICEFTGTINAEKAAVNEQVAKFFNDTVQRREDGYYVRLPYKDNHPPLPNNKHIALKRLHSVIEKLKKTPHILQDYTQTFLTHLEKGIIEEVSTDSPPKGTIVHYIPHQPVLTPHKETTKLRIVFDASSHYKECPSLNDILHQGPLILPEIYALLICFRVPPYVAISDVEKAFLQIRLHELDRDATRFLWVHDTSAPVDEHNIVTYRFTRVAFGLNVSPYLLAGTILHHLRNTVENTDLANEIQNNLYVDNLITLAFTPEELFSKVAASRQIFKDMKMNLREFLSNDHRLRDLLPKDAIARSRNQKLLGIAWNASDDLLTISCSISHSDVITKRVVAHQIASVYDPLGWLVPLLTQAKHFQQSLWENKLEWDEPLPAHLEKQWYDITSNVDGYEHSFPRRFLPSAGDCNIAIFADASDIAMAACAYLYNADSSAIIMARCKLPSIKTTITIPKMELNALTMAVRLAWATYQALKYQIARLSQSPLTIYIFSDSQIVLSWLTAAPNNTTLGVLVCNRLKEIRSIIEALSDENVSVRFAYINTKDNPADAGTRGLTKNQLVSHVWWTGPHFIRQPPICWPVIFYPHVDNHQSAKSDEKMANTASISTMPSQDNDIIDLTRYNSFVKATRVLARALLFIRKLMRPLEKHLREEVGGTTSELKHLPHDPRVPTAEYLQAARLIIIRLHQSVYITAAYRKSLNQSLRLSKDVYHIWRSQGRLNTSTLHVDAKQPAFVAANTPLADLIIQDAHGTYHRGIEHTIATVREHYWIPKLRQQVRKLINRCVKCRRFNGLPYSYPEMTDLPERRVLRSRPFQHIGLDYFDLPSCPPNREALYGCIFTCTVTRLVHLEVVNSMNTENFINALRRFIARRGVPESITCDNAPTFLLGASILNNDTSTSMVNEDIISATADKEIRWHHITPYAPWKGGFYERLIKSVKHALYKALRGSDLRSEDQLRTIIIEIEGVLNSRPLTYQGSSHEILSSIRPLDFIQKDLNVTLHLDHITETTTLDPDYYPPNHARTLQTQQEVIEALHSSCTITERFWNIWQHQYLTSLREVHKSRLQQRGKRLIPTIGDIVLLSDPVLPRNDWRMARITTIRESKDGQIRDVELVTSTKRRIRRPPNLLVPLEISSPSGVVEETTSTQPVNTPPIALESSEDAHSETPYNLRPRRPVHYTEHVVTSRSRPTGSYKTTKWFLFYVMSVLLFMPPTLQTTNTNLVCKPTGVMVSPRNETFELCADNYCQNFPPSNQPRLIKFPPAITLHNHLVTEMASPRCTPNPERLLQQP